MLNHQDLAERFEVSAGICEPISNYARERGIDVGPLAAAVGLDPRVFGDVTVRISLDRVCRLLETLAMVTHDDAFGLKLGARFRLGASGPLGYALMHAPTLRDALTFFARHLGRMSESATARLEIGERETRLEWNYSPLIVHRDQYVDMVACITTTHFRSILASASGAARVELERKRPENPQLFRDLITRQIVFDAPVNAFVVPSDLVGTANPRADPVLFRLMDLQCETMRQTRQGETDFLVALRLFLVDRIDRPVILADVAHHTGMSERTLQRRLAEAGTNLHELIDELRRELAERLLTETALTLSQIAYRLGFSAPSAFTRSAIRWFGMPPSDLRRARNVTPAHHAKAPGHPPIGS